MRSKIAVAVVSGVLSAAIGCREPYTIVPVAPSVNLSKNWIYLHAKPPLRWSQPVEEFSFHIDSPHSFGQINDGHTVDIVLPNGGRCSIDVELIAQGGRSYAMDSGGVLGGDMYLTFKTKPPKLTSIEAVGIRSSTPLHISHLLWRGYDPAKVKR
jgi:hypothetical protein